MSTDLNRTVQVRTPTVNMATNQLNDLTTKLDNISIFDADGLQVKGSQIMPADEDKYSMVVFLRNFA